MMTRQHYCLFASHIDNLRKDLAKTPENYTYLDSMVNDLCYIFLDDNRRFDRDRFRTATGLYT